MLIILVVIFICLTLLSSSNATIEKGLFGEEKRFHSENYSIAEREGCDIHSKEDLKIGTTIADLYYTGEGNTIPFTYVYCISPEDIGIDENGDNMFKDNYTSTAGYFPQLAHPKITILENYTKNGLTLYHIKKTENAITGDGIYNYYYRYGVGEKEGYTYCILSESVGEENTEYINKNEELKREEEKFLEIFNSIKRENN